MGVLGKIFGTKKAIEETSKIINRSIVSLDDAIFTNEEKARRFLDLLKAYEPFKLIQRFLAILFSSVYMFVFLVSIGIIVYGIVENDTLFIEKGKDLIGLENDVLGNIIFAIVSLYFLGGTINGFVKRKEK